MATADSDGVKSSVCKLRPDSPQALRCATLRVDSGDVVTAKGPAKGLPKSRPKVEMLRGEWQLENRVTTPAFDVAPAVPLSAAPV